MSQFIVHIFALDNQLAFIFAFIFSHFYISLCRSHFLSLIIFLLPKEPLLTFFVLQVCSEWILLAFDSLKKSSFLLDFFKDIFTGHRLLIWRLLFSVCKDAVSLFSVLHDFWWVVSCNYSSIFALCMKCVLFPLATFKIFLFHLSGICLMCLEVECVYCLLRLVSSELLGCVVWCISLFWHNWFLTITPWNISFAPFSLLV